MKETMSGCFFSEHGVFVISNIQYWS